MADSEEEIPQDFEVDSGDDGGESESDGDEIDTDTLLTLQDIASKI